MRLSECKLLKLSFCLFLALGFQCELAVAENTKTPLTQPTNTRPKIGLVLSGGGARGFAHIGVLKVLEENNVPIDFIVGTSMGSIIGGLYAIGLTPAEIENSVHDISWDKIFNDFAYREYKTYRRKQDDFDFFNIYRIGVSSSGLQLSPGLIEGQQIELALDRLAYPGFHINDYDRLRIPFRVIATNIENGEPFIIQNGNMARAMRASMSIPGALPPITIDNTLLVDGGIANNIPIDVARNMGADIIIVVDVSAPLADKDDIKSSIDITSQLTTIMTRRNADTQLKMLNGADILIVPKEAQISSSDFDKYPELIIAGETAARKKLAAIKKLSLSAEGYAADFRLRPAVAIKDPVIDYIKIDNSTTLRDEVMQLRIRQKIGKKLNVKQLEEDLSYIYGLDYSSSVDYVLENVDDKTGLIIYARDRDWAYNYLQFGLSIKSESNSGAFTNFSAAYIKHDLNDLAGELRTTASLGSEPSLSAEIYQPLNSNLDIFVAAKVGIETEVFPNSTDNNLDSIERFQRNYIDLSAGKTFYQTTEALFGVGRTDGRTVTLVGDSLLSDDNFNEGFYYGRLFYDSLDNLSFPNSGFFGGVGFKANTQSLGADSDYEQFQMLLSGAKTLQRYTVFSRAIIETTVDERAPFNALFRHGGFLELSGTLDKEIVGQHFGMVEAAFYRRLGNITFLPIYAGFSLEVGNAWDRYSDISTNDTLIASSLFIGADTFAGPLYLAIGITEGGQEAIYFNLGQTFLSNH